jgi:alpha-tubulin suppressor-like RCC1 family protein
MRRVSGVCVFAVFAAVGGVLGSGVTVGAYEGQVSAGPVSASAAAPVVGGLGYVPLGEPCRVVDTRNAGGAISAGEYRLFQVAGSGVNFGAQGGSDNGCGIPDGVGAAEVSVTAVAPAGTGWLRVGPNDGSEPAATFLAYNSGVGITNTGTVPLDRANLQDLLVRNFAGETELVVDVQGYYTAGSGLGYVPLAAPCRLVDTRIGGGEIGLDEFRSFQVAGTGANFAAQGGTAGGCGIPAGVTAAEISVTAVAPSGSGYVRIAPNDGSNPWATFFAYSSGIGITNTGSVTMAAAWDSKDLMVRNFAAGTQLVIDVQGYFPASGGTRYQTVTPCRIVDTRSVGGLIPSGATRGFQVGGTRVGFIAQGAASSAGCGVPQRAVAVEASLTAVTPAANGYGRVFPAGATPPNATFLAYSTGRNITNTGTIALARSGLNDLNLKNFASSTQFVLDVLGYFEPPLAYPLSTEQIAAGADHTCQLRSIGTASCWGWNDHGQLGDGTAVASTVPVDVISLAGAVQIATGDSHSCALIADGTAKCWGANNYAQLGNGDNTIDDRHEPSAVSGLVGAIQIAAAGDHSCALLADGTAKCWGASHYGETTDGSMLPTTVAGLSNATQIAAATDHTCALLKDGTGKCWGSNDVGAIGDGTTEFRPSPTVVSGLTGAIQITATWGGTCALLADATAKCWGGYEGDTLPTPVPALTGATQIVTAGEHRCALVADGTTKCWGENYSGELGDNSTVSKILPTTVLSLSGALQITATGGGTCALLVAGTAKCWGGNYTGRVGDGTNVDRHIATLVSGLSGSAAVTQVAAGITHSCALLADGTAKCWGANDSGQLGDGSTLSRPIPSKVLGLTDATQISASSSTTCALLSNGTVKCWGNNYTGQVGDGTTQDKLVPTAVTGVSGAIQIAAGSNHTCALLADGAAKCWGYNAWGQLGDGSIWNKSVPTSVLGLAGAIQIAAGESHTCALLADGTAKCWGSGGNGELGNGTTGTKLVPTPVTGLTGIAQISAGTGHTCAVITGGTAKCWGHNYYGELGDNTNVDKLVPTAVSTLTGVIQITATSNYHSCALLTGGTAKCWGYNAVGQLGDNTRVDKRVPTAVSGLRGATQITAGYDHTCAVLSAGPVQCWGYNPDGQVGDTTTTDRLVPTAVVGLP